MRHLAISLSLVASLGLIACGPPPLNTAATETLNGFEPADLTDTEVRNDGLYSAPQAYAVGMFMALGLAGELQSGAEADGCPTLTLNENTRTYEGKGCTTADGVTYNGKVVATISATTTTFHTTAGNASPEAEAPDDIEVEFIGFSKSEAKGCDDGVSTVTVTATYNGTFFSHRGEDDMTFEYGVRVDGEATDLAACTKTPQKGGMEYSGTASQLVDSDSNGSVDKSVWSGYGRAGNSVDGVISNQTIDEVFDISVCATEAVSGKTIQRAGEHVAEYTYDGAESCSPDSIVPWTLNGEAQTPLESMSCASAGGEAGWAGLLLLGLLRRRRQ